MSFEWILILIVVFVTLIFMVLALLFPEWVGISGKNATAENQEVLELERQVSGPTAVASPTTQPGTSSTSSGDEHSKGDS